MGFISPTDPLDTYPVIDPLYGIDGFRNVDLISDLDLIPNSRRRAGMVVGVSGGTEYYKLNPSPWNGDITDWSTFSLGGLEILPFTTINDFPSTGSTSYLYLDQTESNIYAWDTTILDYTLLNSSNPPLPPDVIPLTFSNAATVGVLSNNPVYYNGPLNDGVGAILSGSTNGLISDGSSPGRIDFTYTGTSGDTLLVKNQLISANPLLNKGFQNGLYVITDPGSVSSPYILTRVSDFDESSELYPLQVNVLGGSNNLLKYFIQTTINPIIGTNNIVFSISAQQNIVYQISFVDTSTSSALPSCVYASGTTFPTLPGNGATLTAQSVGGPLIIDGMTASTSTVTNNTFNRLLVKDQTGPLSYQNGDYIVIRPGSATTTWQLRRINNWAGAFDRYTRFFLVSNTQSPKAGKLYFTTKNVPPLTNLTIGTAPINIVEYGGVVSGGTFTGNTSATCISDIFVSNIHSCSPLNINPLDEGNVYFGSTSAVTIDLTNNIVGIGTTTPTTKLDINGGTRHRGNVTMDPTTSISWTDTSAVFPTSLNNRILWVLNNDSAQLYAFQPRTDKLDFVFKVADNVPGLQGDEFVYWVDSVNGEQDDSYPLSMGQNFIVNPTRRYALSTSTSGAGNTDFYILQSGATALTQSVMFADVSTSNVGIGTSSPTKKLDVLGDARISGTGQNILTLIGSGNSTTSPLFTVQGSSGELFTVSDNLVGSLFSVNNISGLPVLEAFSDDTILMGTYSAPSLNSTAKVIATTGTTNIFSIPTSAYTGAFFDYTVSDGTNLRAGNIMSIWSGTSVNMTEVQTTSFGSTTGLTFNMVVSSGNAILTTSGATGNWTVKTIVRSI